MCRHGVIAVVLLSAATATPQAQTTPVASSPPSQLATSIAYFAEPGLAAPEMLPVHVKDLATGQCKDMDGVVRLSAIVDTQGIPVDISFLRPLGNDLDRTALRIMSVDRFRPATRDGIPVAVVISDEIRIFACIVKIANDAGGSRVALQLRTNPDQEINLQKAQGKEATLKFVDSRSQPLSNNDTDLSKLGRAVTPPVILHQAQAEFSDEARKKQINGACLVSLVVDAQGMPRDLRIEKSIDPVLDRNALIAISEYRFKPASKDGIPVPVKIEIEVGFGSFGGSPPFPPQSLPPSR